VLALTFAMAFALNGAWPAGGVTDGGLRGLNDGQHMRGNARRRTRDDCHQCDDGEHARLRPQDDPVRAIGVRQRGLHAGNARVEREIPEL